MSLRSLVVTAMMCDVPWSDGTGNALGLPDVVTDLHLVKYFSDTVTVLCLHL